MDLSAPPAAARPADRLVSTCREQDREQLRAELKEAQLQLQSGGLAAEGKVNAVLSDKAILRHLLAGTVAIHPFNRANLSTSSYDVTLGPWYYRERAPRPGVGVFNPYDKAHVDRVWGTLFEAEEAQAWSKATGMSLENIDPKDRVVWISPGETILAHTQEFIGGRRSVTTMMKARSSMGRNFIAVCKCAGWGDVGYVNRWTMEITNNSRHYAIPLIVGRRIAQIVFFDTEGTLGGREYCSKYQQDPRAVEAEWKPEAMLPRMYDDREVRFMKEEQEKKRQLMGEDVDAAVTEDVAA